MDAFRVKCTRFYNLLNLNDACASSRSYSWVEITSRLTELHITRLICAPSLDKSKVSSQGLFQDVLLAIVSTKFTRRRSDKCSIVWANLDWESTFLNQSTDSSWGVEGWDTSASCSAFLSQGTLWYKLNLELT